MMKFLTIIYTCAVILMVTSCQSADKPSDSKESLTPVEASDKQRYNINEADKAVIQLDSAARDSTLRDTLKN